jgi:hypothetical protein
MTGTDRRCGTSLTDPAPSKGGFFFAWPKAASLQETAMHFDFTFNVPVLVTLLLAAAAFISRHTRVEIMLEGLVKRMESHEAQDERRHGEVDTRLRGVETGLAAAQTTHRR